MDKNSLDISSLHFYLPIPHYLDFFPQNEILLFFFLEQICSIAIIKPDAVITRKDREIKEKVSNIYPKWFTLIAK